VEARKAPATVLAVAECKSRPTLSKKLSGKKAATVSGALVRRLRAWELDLRERFGVLLTS